MRPLRKTGMRRLQAGIARAHPPQAEIAFLLQNLDDPVNVGALFRIADACAAREMILVGETPMPPHPGISLTARGCERRVPWRHIQHIEDAIAALKSASYHLLALEIAADAWVYTEYDYPDKVCLVLGGEGEGVWPKTLRLCDGAVFIPMYGKGPSLNVHVAAALVAYHIRMRRW
ncbi:MAG TPA: TrmH family RNA methyltransferase [Anaerolineae bacterium]